MRSSSVSVLAGCLGMALAVAFCLQAVPVWAQGGSSPATANPSANRPASAAAYHLAQVAANLKKDRAAIRQYEWVETSTFSYNGEEKSKSQDRCYYDVNGKVV